MHFDDQTNVSDCLLKGFYATCCAQLRVRYGAVEKKEYQSPLQPQHILASFSSQGIIRNFSLGSERTSDDMVCLFSLMVTYI